MRKGSCEGTFSKIHFVSRGWGTDFHWSTHIKVKVHTCPSMPCKQLTLEILINKKTYKIHKITKGKQLFLSMTEPG